MTLSEFETLLDNYERDLYSFCLHLARDTYTAQDLFQETALSAFEMMEIIDPAHNPKSFLLAIAFNKWRNYQKKYVRRQVIAPVAAPEELKSVGFNETEDAVMRFQVQEAIKKAIDEMKDKFRIPLILYYFDDFSIEEISKIVKTPTGTVKSRLHKARELARKTLQKEGIHIE